MSDTHNLFAIYNDDMQEKLATFSCIKMINFIGDFNES